MGSLKSRSRLANNNIGFSLAQKGGAQLSLQRKGLPGLPVSDNKSVIHLHYYSSLLETYRLTHYPTSVAERGRKCLYHQHVIQLCRIAEVYVYVHDHEHILLLCEQIQHRMRLHECPAPVLQELQIPCVVYMAEDVYVISTDLDFYRFCHSLLLR